MRLIKACVAIFTVLFLMAPVCPASAEISGSISGSYYNHEDDLTEHTYSISRLRIRLDATRLAGGDSMSFHLKGSTRSSSGIDYNKDIPNSRIDTAKLSVKDIFSFLDVDFGRQYITELMGARVDGALLRFNVTDTFGVGAFAGNEPDPYDDGFSGDYSTVGGFGFLRTPTAGISGGYVRNDYKGKEDQTYIAGTAFAALSQSFRLYAVYRTDHNVVDDSFEVTNMLVSASFRPSRYSNIQLAYNQYRAIRRYESMDYSLDYLGQTSVRLSAQFRVTKTTKIYGRFDSRSREIDGGSASLILLGFRQSELFNLFFIDASVRSINYFTADITQIYGAVGVEMNNNLTIEFNTMYLTNTQDGTDITMNQYVFGGRVSWFERSGLFVTGHVEFSNEAYVDVDSIYLAKNSDEYSSMSYFLSVGYRF